MISLFNKKQKLSFIAIERLIEETAKNSLSTIVETVSKADKEIDEKVVKINVLAINYELVRYELYKGNAKKDVDEAMDDIYSNVPYIVNVNSEAKDKCEEYIDQVISKSKQIFNVKKLVAPAKKYVYRLLLEQLGLREDKLEAILVQEFEFYAECWVNNMYSIAATYIIDTSEEGRKSDTIDFRF